MGEQKPGSERKAELEKDIFQLQLVVWHAEWARILWNLSESSL